MAYPKEVRESLIGYCNDGHSVREAQKKFGISKSTASLWSRAANGSRRKSSPHPVKYPEKTVRLAIGLAYGSNGFTLTEVAHMLGISAPTVCSWKRRYVDGGIMEIPEIPPEEVANAVGTDLEGLGEEQLKAMVRELELKNAALEETVNASEGGSIDGLTNAEKALAVDALVPRFGVTDSLRAMRMASSSYYYIKAAKAAPDKYTEARAAVAEEFETAKRRRGYRYIRMRLRARENPITLSGKVVRRLMAEEGCVVAYGKRKRRYSSYAGEISKAPENLVRRDFRASGPNRLWLTDITEFHIDAGKACLSPMIDCFDGFPVAWTIGTSPNAELVNEMLGDACRKLADDERPVIHSDRGAHYRWPGWIALCERNGLVRSMSAKGCSPDNSACEGFFGRLKNEFFYYNDWGKVSIEGFMEELDTYMHYYAEEREKESLGWLSPLRYRKSLGIAA